MMTSIKKIFILYKKDFLLELRTKITLTSIVLFAFLMLLIFSFGFQIQSSNINNYASGVLWITFSFAGVLALSRLFEHEKERWGIKGLIMSPMDKICIYLSKFLIHYSLMLFLELAVIFLFVILFNPNWTVAIIYKIIFVSLTGTIGFSALGILVSSMLFNERLKDLLLPLIFYPAVIPLIIAAVKSTNSILSDGTVILVPFMLGFDIIFMVACALLYEFVLEGN